MVLDLQAATAGLQSSFIILVKISSKNKTEKLNVPEKCCDCRGAFKGHSKFSQGERDLVTWSQL